MTEIEQITALLNEAHSCVRHARRCLNEARTLALKTRYTDDDMDYVSRRLNASFYVSQDLEARIDGLLIDTGEPVINEPVYVNNIILFRGKR